MNTKNTNDARKSGLGSAANENSAASLLQNRLLGDVVRYGGEDWTIGSIMFIGERYYGLTAQDGSVALVPAVALDNIA